MVLSFFNDFSDLVEIYIFSHSNDFLFFFYDFSDLDLIFSHFY